MSMSGGRGGKEVLYSYGFNQDGSCVAVGTSKGYAVYNSEPFRLWLHEAVGGVAIAEMLFCTSLLALVGAGDQAGFSPRCLRVWNTKRRASLYDLGFVSKILAVKMNRRRLAVCLERSLYLFDLETMQRLQDMDTPPNPRGLVALSPREQEPSYLASPGPGEGEDKGVILLYDALSLKLANKIPAHRNPLATMAFSLDGALLATASEQGTVIRVFSIPTGERLHTLRRGRSPCSLHCLAFNHAATRLAASSDKGTVHVFQFAGGAGGAAGAAGATGGNDAAASPSPSRRHRPPYSTADAASPSAGHRPASSSAAAASHHHQSTGGGGGGGAMPLVSSVSSALLPARFADAVEGERSFAQARLKDAAGRGSSGGGGGGGGGPVVCALVPKRKATGLKKNSGGGGGGGEDEEEGEALVVLTGEGHFYQFGVDLVNGGACRLLEEKSLLQEEDAAQQALAPRLLGGGSSSGGGGGDAGGAGMVIG